MLDTGVWTMDGEPRRWWFVCTRGRAEPPGGAIEIWLLAIKSNPLPHPLSSVRLRLMRRELIDTMRQLGRPTIESIESIDTDAIRRVRGFEHEQGRN